MKEYEVEITETLKKTVVVEAENAEQAGEIADRAWKDGEYILDAENFTEVDFFVKE